MRKRKLTASKTRTAIAEIADGATTGQVALRYGVNAATLWRAAQHYGLAQDLKDASLARAEKLAEEALAIVDAVDRNDPRDVERRKLRSDVRLRLAAALAPSTYGRASQAAAGSSPLQIAIVTGVPPLPGASTPNSPGGPSQGVPPISGSTRRVSVWPTVGLGESVFDDDAEE